MVLPSITTNQISRLSQVPQYLNELTSKLNGLSNNPSTDIRHLYQSGIVHFSNQRPRGQLLSIHGDFNDVSTDFGRHELDTLHPCSAPGQYPRLYRPLTRRNDVHHKIVRCHIGTSYDFENRWSVGRHQPRGVPQNWQIWVRHDVHMPGTSLKKHKVLVNPPWCTWPRYDTSSHALLAAVRVLRRKRNSRAIKSRTSAMVTRWLVLLWHRSCGQHNQVGGVRGERHSYANYR